MGPHLIIALVYSRARKHNYGEAERAVRLAVIGRSAGGLAPGVKCGTQPLMRSAARSAPCENRLHVVCNWGYFKADKMLESAPPTGSWVPEKLSIDCQLSGQAGPEQECIIDFLAANNNELLSA